MKEIIIHCDGASRGNPGEAGIGVLIESENGEVLEEYYEYIGVATNNESEYKALIKSLELSTNHTRQSVKVYSDSELVVKQLNKEYKVKSKGLKPLYTRVKNLEQNFSKVKYFHVKRDLNERADELANQALDESMN